MADTDKGDTFFQEEQQAQEELEKIKIGETEYEPKQLEEMVQKANKVDEYQKKYNTDFDKAWSSYGKTTQENKTLKEEVEKLRAETQTRQQAAAPGELSEEQIQQAREQARKIGIVTQGDLDNWYQSRRAAEKLLETCGTHEKDITGEDGRPKFVTEEILNHMSETGIKDPLKAYRDKYEPELDKWKESELGKAKGQVLPTLTSSLAPKQPVRPTITKDNLQQMIREQLEGNQE